MSQNNTSSKDKAIHNKLSSSLLNVVLVFIESTLTLVLRFDAKLRQAAYPLAKTKTIVCIRTYLPHTQIYATFSPQGILLDDKLPSNRTEPDVVINGYSIQFFNIMVSHDPKHVNKLPIRGADEAVENVRNFLLQLGIGSLVQSVIKNFKGNKPSADDTEKKEKSKDSIDVYKQKIEQQQTQLNVLTKKNRELEMACKELESKQKVMIITIGVLAIIAIAAMIGWLT